MAAAQHRIASIEISRHRLAFEPPFRPSWDSKPRHHFDATIVKVIEEGGAAVGLSNEMPDWQGALDDDEIAALAKYIRGFCAKPQTSSATPQP